MKKYNVGDTIYIIESNRIIREARILRFGGGFYTIRFIDSGGGIKVRENRLFASQEAASKALSQRM